MLIVRGRKAASDADDCAREHAFRMNPKSLLQGA